MTPVLDVRLADLGTDALRRLANSHLPDPYVQHAVDQELLRREQADELAAYQQRLTGMSREQVREQARYWAGQRGNQPGDQAYEHRRLIDAELEYRLGARHEHELAGGGGA